MRSPDQVLDLWQERSKYYASLHAAQQEIKDVYSGKVLVDLPDLDTNQKVFAPNLLAQGLDQMAGRVGGVIPVSTFAPRDLAVKKEVRRARVAKATVDGWNELDRLPLQLRRRARYLLGLSMSPVVIRWNHDEHRPVREVRDPIETYASPESIDGTCMPTDCLFVFKRSAGWLCDYGYEPQVRQVTRSSGYQDLSRSQMLTCLEYVDGDGRMLCLMGQGANYQPDLPQIWQVPASSECVLLEFAPTRWGYEDMLVSVPTRIALDRPMGQFDSMVGMYYQQAKMMALEVLATEKDIFPDVYLVGRLGEQPKFVHGPVDGRSGDVNIVQGGVPQALPSAANYMAAQVIDRIERNSRITAGIPAEFGGESPTNIRTGRRGDSVMSQVVDFPVAEAQDILAYALQDEQRAMIRLTKQMDGRATRTIWVGTSNARKAVTYVADEIFVEEDHVVYYPVSGVDQNALRIGIGQAVGLGTMSIQTAAELDPMISDAEQEHDRKIYEGLEQAQMAWLQQQAMAPPGQGLPQATFVRIQELVLSDRKEVGEAIIQATSEAQAAAAAQQGPPAPGAPPPTPQEAAAPGAVAAVTGAPSAIPGASGTQQDLAHLVTTLRRPTQTTVPLRGLAQGAV